VTKLCAANKSKKVEFSIRETTQGSKKKTYGPYLGEMKKLKTPIELKERVIRYETNVHLKNEKSSTTEPSKKMRGGENYFNNLSRHQSDIEFPVENLIRHTRLERKLIKSQKRLEDVQRIQQEMNISNEEIEHIREGFELVKRGDELFNRAWLLTTQNKKELFDAAFDLFKRSYDEYKNPNACERISRYYSTVGARGTIITNGSDIHHFSPWSDIIVSKIEKNRELSKKYLIEALILIKKIHKKLSHIYSEYPLITIKAIMHILFHKFGIREHDSLT
jgi:hypothetical protein